MKCRLCIALSALILSAASGIVLAQDYDYHPFLSDHFAVLGQRRPVAFAQISAILSVTGY